MPWEGGPGSFRPSGFASISCRPQDKRAHTREMTAQKTTLTLSLHWGIFPSVLTHFLHMGCSPMVVFTVVLSAWHGCSRRCGLCRVWDGELERSRQGQRAMPGWAVGERPKWKEGTVRGGTCFLLELMP